LNIKFTTSVNKSCQFKPWKKNLAKDLADKKKGYFFAARNGKSGVLGQTGITGITSRN
jgi:hypothetical protein